MFTFFLSGVIFQILGKMNNMKNKRLRVNVNHTSVKAYLSVCSFQTFFSPVIKRITLLKIVVNSKSDIYKNHVQNELVGVG